MENNLLNIAEDIVDNNTAPGIPAPWVTIITKNVQIIGGVDGFSVCLNTSELEAAIRKHIAPITMLYGVSTDGIDRGSWTGESKYDTPEEILKNKEENYYFDTEILNYVYSIPAAVNHLDDLADNEILMIQYSPEAGISCMERFSNLADLENEIYEEYQFEKLHN